MHFGATFKGSYCNFFTVFTDGMNKEFERSWLSTTMGTYMFLVPKWNLCKRKGDLPHVATLHTLYWIHVSTGNECRLSFCSNNRSIKYFCVHFSIWLLFKRFALKIRESECHSGYYWYCISHQIRNVKDYCLSSTWLQNDGCICEVIYDLWSNLHWKVHGVNSNLIIKSAKVHSTTCMVILDLKLHVYVNTDEKVVLG